MRVGTVACSASQQLQRNVRGSNNDSPARLEPNANHNTHVVAMNVPRQNDEIPPPQSCDVRSFHSACV